MIGDQATTLPAYVRQVRLRAGLSQEALAERAGLTADTVGKLERGLRRRLHPHTARALADALGLSDAERAELAALAHAAPVTSVAAASPPEAPPSSAVPALSLPLTFTGLAGREQELGALRRSLDAACQGQSQVVLLAGEAGIGKTRLAEELAGIAAARGVRTLWGRCYEGDGAPAFWPWVQILRAHFRGRDADAVRVELGAGAADILQLLPELGALLPDLPPTPPLEPAQARFRLFDAVTSLLTGSASPPLALILDDLHWADTPSLLLLEFLVRELGKHPLLLLGTYRSVEVSRGHPLARALSGLAGSPRVTRLLLGGLDASAAAEVIEAVTGRAPTGELCAALVEQTEGNPLFLTELARLLTAEGHFPLGSGRPASGLGLPVPPTVREVIGRRLERLAPECVRALTVAAVIGREFGGDVLGHAGELSGEALLTVLEDAEMAQVIEAVPGALDRYRFRHTLIRETLYEDLPSTRRARLHRRVGEALEGAHAHQGPHLASMAVHYRLAVATGTIEKAIAYSRRAADAAMGVFAWEEAVVHWQAALELLEGQALAVEPAAGMRRCEVLVALGEARRRAGDVLDAKATFRKAAVLARQLGAPKLLALAALGYGEYRAHADPSSAIEIDLLETALSVLGEEDALRARVLGVLAEILVRAGAHERAAAVSRDAVALGRRIRDPATQAFVLNGRLHALWPFAGREHEEERSALAAEMVGLAATTGDEELAVKGRRWRVLGLLERGAIADVERELSLCAPSVAALRQTVPLWWLAIWKSALALQSGRFDQAERLIEEAKDIWPPGLRMDEQAPSYAEHARATQMFILLRDQGRLGELVALAETYRLRYPPEPWFQGALGLLACELGHEADAQAELDRLAADEFAALRGAARPAGAGALLAEACATLGDRRRAAPLYDLLLPWAGHNVVLAPAMLKEAVTCLGAASRYLGLLAATLGRWETAVQHFEHALVMNAQMEASPWVARTQYDYAAMLMARGRPGDYARVDTLLAQAAATTRALGMARLSDAAAALRTRFARPSTEAVV